MLSALVADDDEDSRAWLRAVLESAGIEVDEALDGADLLWVLGQPHSYDIVITDVLMPLPQGHTVVAMARSLGMETPFLVVSSHMGAPIIDALAGMARVRVLAKPLSRARVLASITSVLEDPWSA